MSRRSSRLATNGYYQEEHSYQEGDSSSSAASSGGARYRENVARSREDERVFRARKSPHRASDVSLRSTRRGHSDSALVAAEDGNSSRLDDDDQSLTSTLIEESCLPERECSGYLWGLDKEEDQSTVMSASLVIERTTLNETQRNFHHNSIPPAHAVATDGHAGRLWEKHSRHQHPPEPARSSRLKRVVTWVAQPVNVYWALVARFTFHCVGVLIARACGALRGMADSRTTRKPVTSGSFFGRLVLKCMWVFGVGWYNLIGLLSLFNVFLLTRHIPRAVKNILLWMLLLLAVVGVGYMLLAFGYVNLSRNLEHTPAVPSSYVKPAPAQSQHRLEQLEQQVSLLQGIVEQQHQKLAQLWSTAERHREHEHALEQLRGTVQQQQHKLGDLKKLGEGERHERDRLASSVGILEENVANLKHEILHGHQKKVEAAVVTALGALATRDGDGPELAPFVAWLTTRLLASEHMRALLRETEQAVVANVSKRWTWPPERAMAQETPGGSVSRQDVYAIVQSALRLYQEDKIGRFDFALESAGGTVISVRCSEAYSHQVALITLFGWPLWYTSQSPRVIIQPDVHPGDCWAFKGSRGYVAIKLSNTIYPLDFTLEHIPRSLSPSGDITSAPKDFAVYGLDEESQQEGHLLGQYVYDKHGDPLQMFHVMDAEEAHPFGIVELRILSNWGNSEYTCIYRFRVHGELAISRG